MRLVGKAKITLQSESCLLERTAGGANPLTLSNGESRAYLQEGDEVIMTAFCQGSGYRIGFGEAIPIALQDAKFIIPPERAIWMFFARKTSKDW
ncbi:MAG: hypothetical protein HKM04_11890 [Legionellales bacterium]|nr:hypothetical protein [Legionellales bacterium]